MPTLARHSRYEIYELWREGDRLGRALAVTKGRVAAEATALRQWSVSINGLLEDGIVPAHRGAIAPALMGMGGATATETMTVRPGDCFVVVKTLKEMLTPLGDDPYSFVPTRVRGRDYVAFLTAAKKVDSKIHTLGTAVNLRDVTKKSKLDENVARRCLARMIDDELAYYMLDEVDAFNLELNSDIDDFINDAAREEEQTPRPETAHSQPATRPVRQAVIVTALAVEYNAVLAHLREVHEEIHPEGTVYQRGTFDTESGPWTVAIVEIGAGNAGSALEAERAIAHFRPSVVMFVGVAGGVKDVELGDVVAATKVHFYESGKDATEYQPRTASDSSSYRLVQRARAEARKPDWRRRIIGTSAIGTPKAIAAPIAAGEKVIANRTSSFFAFLRRNFGDAVAVEMEGYGFLLASHANSVHAIVIRGISDLLEKKAESDAEGSQETASRHAGAFAFEVLAKFGTEAEQGARDARGAGGAGGTIGEGGHGGVGGSVGTGGGGGGGGVFAPGGRGGAGGPLGGGGGGGGGGGLRTGGAGGTGGQGPAGGGGGGGAGPSALAALAQLAESRGMSLQQLARVLKLDLSDPKLMYGAPGGTGGAGAAGGGEGGQGGGIITPSAARMTKEKFDAERKRASTNAVDIGNIVLRYSFGTEKKIQPAGMVLLGNVEDESFQLSVPTGQGIYIVAVPFEFVRVCWINEQGQLAVRFTAPLVLQESGLAFE